MVDAALRLFYDRGMAKQISLEFIGRSLRDLHEEMRAVRAELRDVRTFVLQNVDQGRRLRDDLELMIRSETMGRYAHLEMMLERRFGDIHERFVALEHADR